MPISIAIPLTISLASWVFAAGIVFQKLKALDNSINNGLAAAVQQNSINLARLAVLVEYRCSRPAATSSSVEPEGP